MELTENAYGTWHGCIDLGGGMTCTVQVEQRYASKSTRVKRFDLSCCYSPGGSWCMRPIPNVSTIKQAKNPKNWVPVLGGMLRDAALLLEAERERVNKQQATLLAAAARVELAAQTRGAE